MCTFFGLLSDKCLISLLCYVEPFDHCSHTCRIPAGVCLYVQGFELCIFAKQFFFFGIVVKLGGNFEYKPVHFFANKRLFWNECVLPSAKMPRNSNHIANAKTARFLFVSLAEFFVFGSQTNAETLPSGYLDIWRIFRQFMEEFSFSITSSAKPYAELVSFFIESKTFSLWIWWAALEVFFHFSFHLAWIVKRHGNLSLLCDAKFDDAFGESQAFFFPLHLLEFWCNFLKTCLWQN